MQFSFEYLSKKKILNLLSSSYLPSYTAGLTFFIAVAATNLFHQGNWQRVYAAQNFETSKKKFNYFFFYYCSDCLFIWASQEWYAFSIDSTNQRPDLRFFYIIT